ncbi:MAG: hypothetical protein IJK86_00615 [Lachnospiraceae bacterium]|nr:hypothetical protein [Lachnospiraceae bacterium]
MKDIFIQIVKLSLSAALIAGLVMLLRLALKKSPRFLVCALWALVAVRLLIPALPESRASVMPQRISSGTVVEEVAARPVEPVVRVTKDEPQYVKIIQKTPQIPVKYQGGQAYVEVSEKTLEAPKTVGTSIVPVLARIWLGGAVLMLAYMGFSYGRIRRKVRVSVRERGHVYLCDGIASPFILGMFRPKIYIPSELPETDKAYVLAHEQAHLKRLDHVWKPLGWLLLSLHWFNPVMWAAYILLCRDIEMACDEKVTGREGDGFRKAYSEALLACSMPARLVTACPLAFGEVGVKTRIRSVLNYKRPAFWILALTLAACLIAAGCALTNPTQPADTTPDPAATSENTETPADQTEAPTDQATLPTTEEPAPTDPTHAPDIPRGEAKEIPQAADQEGVMLAERVRSWQTSYSTRVYPSEDGPRAEPLVKDGQGPVDLDHVSTYGHFLLDAVSQRLFFAADAVPHALSLDFCQPLMFKMVTETDGHVTPLVPYILSEDAVWRLPEAESEWLSGAQPVYERIDLPAGVRGEDVLDMFSDAPNELLLVTKDCGNYLLNADKNGWEPATRGYQISRQGDLTEIITAKATWTGQIPAADEVRVLAEPDQDSLIFCVIPADTRIATVRYVDGANGYCYESTIDMSDWTCIPNRFARWEAGSLFVLAPRESGIYVQRLVPGTSSVYAEGVREDLTARREEILAGAVLPLYDHKHIDENFPGFLIDMDGDGTLEEIGIAPGLGNRNALTWELNLNGRPAGVSWMNYAQSIQYGSPYTWDEIVWPEEGNFSRERGYEMYLASLDGEHITLFLESMQETYGLDFLEYQDDETLRAGVRIRIRGLHKMMGEFTPNAPLADYIAAGWKVRPADGDRLDLTGNGEENTLRVTNHSSLVNYPVYYDETGMNNVPFNKESMQIGDCWPYSEFVAADNGEAFAVVYTDRSHTGIMGDTVILSFRYGDLYYERNTQGGYDLIGELTLNGSALATRYKLTDQEWNPVTPDANLSKAGFRALGGSSHPLSGAREEDELALRYFAVEREADGGVPAPEGDLETMDKLFRDVFTGFFLMDEYEDVRDIDLGMLFYNGLCTGIAPDQSSELVVSEEEKAEALAAMGETHPLQPLFRIDRQAAEDAFRKFTGHELSEATGKMPGTYVEKYDAWYYLRSDSARSNFRIADAYLNENGEAAVLWNGRDMNTYGIVNLKPAFGGYYIASNRVLTEEELAGSVARGILRAGGDQMLEFTVKDGGRGLQQFTWEDQPILPVDFIYSAESGIAVLDQAGKRIIRKNTLEDVAVSPLDFCDKPSRMAYVRGSGDDRSSRLYILDGKEVLRVKTNAFYGDPVLETRIPLPDGLSAGDIREMQSFFLPGSAYENGDVLLLVTKNNGNYYLTERADAFVPTEEGLQFTQEDGRVRVRQGGAAWDLAIPEEDVRVIRIQSDPLAGAVELVLFVREKDAAAAELRRYDAAGRLQAVSTMDLSDWVSADGNFKGSGEPGERLMAYRSGGLWFYQVEIGLTCLKREREYIDEGFGYLSKAALTEVVDLARGRAYVESEADTGWVVDLDQDGEPELLSVEKSMDPEGNMGLEFYLNGRSTGMNQTLWLGSRVPETSEAFFFPEGEYRLALSSLDGKTVCVLMSSEERTLAVEFVQVLPQFGGSRIIRAARIRMRGEGKTLEDFTPGQGIRKYLEEGWEVRPSEGDVVEGLPAGADVIHMVYGASFNRADSYYQEAIGIGDMRPLTPLGFAADEYGETCRRFDHLTYVRPDGGNPDFIWLKGWMNDGSRETVYGVTGNDGVLQYQIVETAQTTEQPADRIVINLFPEGDVYSMPMVAQVTEDDPLFEAMSWEELAEYYGLTINREAIASVLESVTGEPFTCETTIGLLPSSGIYRNGEYIFDLNGLTFRSTAKNSHRTVEIGFRRDANVLWPKDEYSYDYESKRLETETQYEASYISGVKCYIGQTVYSDGSVVKSVYEIRPPQPVLTITTNDLTEEQMTALLKELFKKLGISG